MRSSRSGVTGPAGADSARSRAGLSPADQKSVQRLGQRRGRLAGLQHAGPARAAGWRAWRGTDLPQRREQVVPGLTAPGQHGERVPVELLGQHVADRRQVLARHAPVRAAAVHVQVGGGPGEQRRAALGEHVLDLVRHLARQQLGPEQRLTGQPFLDPPPLRLGQREHPEADVVGPRPGALDLGGDLALGQPEVEHLPGPGVAAAPGQPAAQARGLEHADEPPGPPLLADRAAPAPRLDPALDPDRLGRRPVLPGTPDPLIRSPRRATGSARRAGRRRTAR